MTNAFTRLRDFIGQKMRMSHIYQPVMLEVLLTHGSSASVRDISAAILAHDESQLDYYEEIVKKMPGKVLSSHGIVRRAKDVYTLQEGVDSLSQEERPDLQRDLHRRPCPVHVFRQPPSLSRRAAPSSVAPPARTRVSYLLLRSRSAVRCTQPTNRDLTSFHVSSALRDGATK